MIEVEIKVQVRDENITGKKLTLLGFEKGNLVQEADYYFDNEAAGFRKSDQALRIRQCENLTTNENVVYMTYKGPKLDSISMTRKELEMRVDDAETGI